MEIISAKEARKAGLRFYFTGKPCPAGHIAPRISINYACSECHKRFLQDWKQRNPEKCAEHARRSNVKNARNVAARKKRWKEANIEHVKANAAAYRKEKREQISEGKKRWYRENYWYARQMQRKYRERNAEVIKLKRDKEKALNPEKFRAWHRAKLARRRAAPGRHTAEDIAEIRRLQSGKCAYCRMKLGKKYHVDHIQPLSRGGTNDRSNLQILCQPCNQHKYARDPLEFAQSLGMLL